MSCVFYFCLYVHVWLLEVLLQAMPSLHRTCATGPRVQCLTGLLQLLSGLLWSEQQHDRLTVPYVELGKGVPKPGHMFLHLDKLLRVFGTDGGALVRGWFVWLGGGATVVSSSVGMCGGVAVSMCRGQWQGVQPDDKDLIKYHSWLQSTGGPGCWLCGGSAAPMGPAAAAAATGAATGEAARAAAAAGVVGIENVGVLAKLEQSDRVQGGVCSLRVAVFTDMLSSCQAGLKAAMTTNLLHSSSS